MVCLGNICRSPLAEGILRHKVEQHHLSWQIDSAGTSGWHSGETPDKRSIDIASKNGIDISKQHSRKLYGFDLEEFDIIYAMDKSNYNDIVSMAKNETERLKVKLILNEIAPHNNEVPDPYYGDENGFENVFNMLNKACDAIIAKYK